MKTSVNTLKKRLGKETDIHCEDILNIMNENIRLINMINKLRSDKDVVERKLNLQKTQNAEAERNLKESISVQPEGSTMQRASRTAGSSRSGRNIRQVKGSRTGSVSNRESLSSRHSATNVAAAASGSQVRLNSSRFRVASRPGSRPPLAPLRQNFLHQNELNALNLEKDKKRAYIQKLYENVESVRHEALRLQEQMRQ
jgi:hypothetical protein